MMVKTTYLKCALLVGVLLSTAIGSAQTIDFDFDTKDYNGEVKPLTDRLDANKNYLVLFSAFWCQPCVKQLDDIFSKNIDIYRDLYNLEIILLNDDYYQESNIALNKIKEKQWYFNQYLTDDLFGDLGVTSIPRDYLIIAGETTGERVYASNFLRKLEAHYIEKGYESSFFVNNTQITVTENCDDISVYNYGGSDSEIILDKQFHKINGQYYRTGIQNKNIYRYDPLIDDEVVVFDFYVDQCSSYTLTDHEGDAIILTIESITKVDDIITIETNQIIKNSCGEDIPFIISSKYGSNAGIVFDIENNEIVSKLVCHSQGDIVLYSSDDLHPLCAPVSTEDEVLVGNLVLSNNPGNGLFEIIGSDLSNIEILDMRGEKVQYQKDGLSFDISDYPAGIYTIIDLENVRVGASVRYLKL